MAYEGLRRNDIMFEGHAVIEGGSFATPWMESAGVITVAVAARFNDSSPAPYLVVEQGQYDADSGGGPRVVRFTEITVENGPLDYAGTCDIYTRYFRVVATAEADSTIAVSVRAVD